MDRIHFLRGLQHKLHGDYNATHEVVFDLVTALLEDETAAKRLMGGLAGLTDNPNKHPETSTGYAVGAEIINDDYPTQNRDKE